MTVWIVKMKKMIDQKENRDFKATKNLRKGLVKKNIDVEELGPGLLRKVALIQSRARGPLFEMMTETIIGNVYGTKKFEKQTVFSTPYGKRRIDLFIPETGVSIEVKSGYGRLRAFTRTQIKKDKHILDHEPTVEQIYWFCFRGATRPLIAYLEKNGIGFCDIEYDRMETQSDTAERTVIRV